MFKKLWLIAGMLIVFSGCATPTPQIVYVEQATPTPLPKVYGNVEVLYSGENGISLKHSDYDGICYVHLYVDSSTMSCIPVD